MAGKDTNWLTSFPVLRKITEPAWEKIVKQARQITVEAGAPVFRDREACENYLLVVDGSVRVQKLAANGQIITLYHLEKGHTCELTTSCLLGGKAYPAEAIAETRVRAVLIPKAQFQEALAQSPQFREFVFSSVDKGMNVLITLVEQVAFGHMDCRLARRLLERAGRDDRLSVTHHVLAEDLGTAREVVSRLLKEFEHLGWVKLRRGCIEIVDRENLRSLSEHTIV